MVCKIILAYNREISQIFIYMHSKQMCNMSDEVYQIEVICENCFVVDILKVKKKELVESYLDALESNRICGKCGCSSLIKITLDQYLNNMDCFSANI